MSRNLALSIFNTIKQQEISVNKSTQLKKNRIQSAYKVRPNSSNTPVSHRRSKTQKKITQHKEFKSSVYFIKCKRQQTQADMIKIAFAKLLQDPSHNNRTILTMRLKTHNAIFKKLEYSLVDSIVYLGRIATYTIGQVWDIPKGIGFIIYGKTKIYNRDYKSIIGQGNTIGQHILFNKNVTLNAKSLQVTAILWLSLQYYQIIRQQSIKCGLKSQFYQLEMQIRLSYIHKKLK